MSLVPLWCAAACTVEPLTRVDSRRAAVRACTGQRNIASRVKRQPGLRGCIFVSVLPCPDLAACVNAVRALHMTSTSKLGLAPTSLGNHMGGSR